MKVYTDAEYDRLYEETLSYEQVETNTRGFDEVEAFKSLWDETRRSYANLSSAIKLEITDTEILLDRSDFTEHNDCDYLTAKFYLSGYHSVISPDIDGIPSEYAETKGQNYLFYLPDIEEVEQHWAGDRLKRLRIEIDRNTIRRFVTELNTVPRTVANID